ncbi:PadR family transcriptional regulator [[Eubacterium] cellulosolvens]
MPIISNIETAVLGLVFEGPRYGYELEKVIEEREMRNWTEIGFSSIYYVLKRLEKNGLITSKLERVEGKPSRKVYSVTDRGHEVMLETVKDLLSKSVKLKFQFDLGLAYSRFLPPEDIIDCLKLYLKSLENRLEFLETKLNSVKKEHPKIHIIGLFTRPIAHLRAEKVWVKKFINEVEKNR